MIRFMFILYSNMLFVTFVIIEYVVVERTLRLRYSEVKSTANIIEYT